MASSDGPLFTLVEALTRLGEVKEQGCLLAHKGAELIHLYVKDGFLIRAYSSTKESDQALEQAFHLAGGSYTWLRGVQPPPTDKLIFLNLKTFIAKHSNVGKPKMIETSRLAGAEKKEKEVESKYRYFLVPQANVTEKIYITKTSTVLGRADTSDVVIANSDVSSRHCILDIQTRGAFLLDLDSTNGTFVNGALIREAYLNPGDRIELGPCEYVINREVLPPL